MKGINIIFSISILILSGCNNSSPKSNLLITSELIDNQQIRNNLKSYIDYCKSREDTVQVLVLNIGTVSDSTNIYISSIKSYSFLKESYPTAFTFFDKVLVVVFTGGEKIMKRDSSNIKSYLKLIDNYSLEQNLTEFALHNPINWSICIKNDTISLNKFLSEDIILDKIYHVKPAVKPKIYFHK